MGEYIAMSAASALIVTMFFGGYQIPWLNTQTMQEHIYLIILLLMFFIPLLSLAFISWMTYNNSCSAEHQRETRFATIFITLFVIALESFLFYLLTSGMDPEQNSIFVMILQISSFALKVMLMNFVFVWVRWTFPRFRYDQTQHLGWRILLPLSLLNIFITAIAVVVLGV
jgi:NADH-quinone oxidoreductase subunit H